MAWYVSMRMCFAVAFHVKNASACFAKWLKAWACTMRLNEDYVRFDRNLYKPIKRIYIMSQGFCTYFQFLCEIAKEENAFKSFAFRRFRAFRITGSNTSQLMCAVELLNKRCYDPFCYPTLGWLPASRIEYVFKLWCSGKFRLKIQTSRKHQQTCSLKEPSALGSFGCRHWGPVRKLETLEKNWDGVFWNLLS